MADYSDYEENKRKRKKCGYVCAVFKNCGQNTSMHGIGHFIGNKNNWKKLLWLFLIIFGLTMVIVHLQMHLSNFMASPVTTDIEHESENFAFPDISFCSLNPTTKRMYRRLNTPHRKGHTREDFIVLGTKYTLPLLKKYENNYEVDTKIHRDIIDRQRSSYTSHKRSFFPSKELIFDCKYRGKDCKDDFVLLNDPFYWNCYTFRPKVRNATTTNPEEGLVIIAYTATEDITEFNDKLWTLMSIQHTFFNSTNVTEFLTAHETGKNFYARILQDAYEPAGLKIAIHDPYTHAYPKGQGFIVPNGEYGKVGLEMLYEHRLDRAAQPCKGRRPTQNVRVAVKDDGTEVYSPYYLTEEDCLSHQSQKEMVKRCGCLSHRYPIVETRKHELCYNFTQFLNDLLKANNKTLEDIPRYGNNRFLEYIQMGADLGDSSEMARNIVKQFQKKMACHDHFILHSASGRAKQENDEHCILGCQSATYKHYLSSSPWPRDFDLYKMMQNIIIPSVSHPNGTFKDIAEEFFFIDPKNQSLWNSSTELIKRNFVRLVIHPMNIKTNVHKERNSYTVLEALSEVGGILGLWMGMSILSAFEVFEMIADMFRGCCCGKKDTKLEQEKANENHEMNVTQRLYPSNDFLDA